MRCLMFGIALSAATVFASSSFAAWAVCASGYQASPKMINGSEDHGQSYTCTGSKAATKLVCSSEFTPQAMSSGQPGSEGAMTMKGEQTAYTCAQPPEPAK